MWDESDRRGHARRRRPERPNRDPVLLFDRAHNFCRGLAGNRSKTGYPLVAQEERPGSGPGVGRADNGAAASMEIMAPAAIAGGLVT
jgi:hypothetical protein